MMQAAVLLATNNAHKIQEFRDIFAVIAQQISLLTPAQKGITLDVAENGRTFAANARRKALAFARAGGMVAVADDSGLEVAALNGAPGLYSARYAGEGASSADRIALLLRNLEGVPMARRQARFVAVIAVAHPSMQDGEVRCCRGSVRGAITFAPHGEGGFGYDPVFFLPPYGCTMAELPCD